MRVDAKSSFFADAPRRTPILKPVFNVNSALVTLNTLTTSSTGISNRKEGDIWYYARILHMKSSTGYAILEPACLSDIML